MLNTKGQTVAQSINNEIKVMELMHTTDRHGLAHANEIRGKVNLAAEFGLITTKEWEDFLHKIFIFINGD